MNEHEDIIARMIEGDASPEEIARLTDAARIDPALRARMAEATALHGMLGIVMEDEFSRERRLQNILKAVKATEQDHFVEAVQDKVREGNRFRRIRRGIAIAAAVALCLTGWMFLAGKHRAVATVARVETVTWGKSVEFDAGSHLKSGQHLSFDSGLVELQIGKRGKMIVEGPADLEFAAADKSILHRGRVVMRVTPAGHGYRMETPGGAVVDLGTEFAVSVGDKGDTETHVLEGEVEAFPNGGGKVLLTRDKALRFAHGGESIPADLGEFYTAMPPTHSKTVNQVHWPLDTITDATTPAVSDGMPPGPKDFRLLSRGSFPPPYGSEGVFGRALRFDGNQAYAESDFRGIGGAAPRTVSFWVKVPKDFNPKEGFAIVSWGNFVPDHPGGVWQIAVNPLVEDGPIGRIRVGTHQGQIVGTRDLRDDNWHHVAAVLYGGSQPNVGTHVLVYLDGKLEPISRRALREISTDIDTATHGVWLGRDITNNAKSLAQDKRRFFRGDIDEVYIFDAALSQSDILRLKDGNVAPE
ncbi:FecR domain-containing protein [Luteolibacter ambystomatis]|uniref:FecR domain-containing protein n=1 Tax=Luteolibacter ambystomatis TaxID=2824561 RepID=A0A975J0Y7_9BACT|nr:LamG-like jellyroll fold domain-containing protein [Luteolibacter ambystomatis]QUE52008.1 FecR domain-containing protein [Luteolibacter ambystomatis]